MKKYFLLFIAVMSLCAISASARTVHVYAADGTLVSTAEETADGSNIFEKGGNYLDNPVAWVSLQYYDTADALSQGVAAGQVYAIGTPRAIEFDVDLDWYSVPEIERATLTPATTATAQDPVQWNNCYINFCVDLKTSTITVLKKTQEWGYSGDLLYHYFIKKEMLPGFSLASPDNLLEQLCVSSTLPSSPGRYVIAESLLASSTVYEPASDGASLALDSNGQSFVPSAATTLAKAAKTFTVPSGAGGATIMKLDNGIWACDREKVKCLYVDASAYALSDNYVAPTAAQGEARMQKLQPVEGAPGVFHGKVKAKADGLTGKMQLVASFASATDARDGIVLDATKVLTSGREAATGLNFYTLYPVQAADWSNWAVKDPASSGRYDDDYTFDLYVTLPLVGETLEATIKHFDAASSEYRQPNDVVFFAGAAQGWNADRTADSQWWLAPVGRNVYERVLYIPEGEGTFRLFTESETWDYEYSIAADWPDFNDVSTPSPALGQTIHLTGNGGFSNWALTDWPGGYLKVRVDLNTRINTDIQLTRVSGPETSTPTFYLPAPECKYLQCMSSQNSVILDKVGADQYEGVVTTVAGEDNIYVTCGTDDNMYGELINPGYPRVILSRADLNDRGDAYSHTARYYTRSIDKVSTGRFMLPDYWEGGDVKVKVDTRAHNITFEADASGIEGVRADDPAVNPALRGIYTLTGVRIDRPVDTLPAGIYIVDGVKRIVR